MRGVGGAASLFFATMSSAPLSPPTPDLADEAVVPSAARAVGVPAEPVRRCLNCDAVLAGRFCAQCGQDADRHVLSLRHALAEVLEEISQADARVWRTLKLLALRPGEL